VIAWLQSIDTALFRFVNQSLTNPVFDWLMPFLSGNPFFIPALVLGCAALIWFGGRRGRLAVLFLALVLALGDRYVCRTLKNATNRDRPYLTLVDTRLRVKIGPSKSLPSSHAANWFAASMVLLIFYRRSWRFMLPMAAAVSLSRVYNGVHYPSDILAGAILGAGYAGAMVWSADALWKWSGHKWWPLWWRRLPFLMQPEMEAGRPEATPDAAAGRPPFGTGGAEPILSPASRAVLLEKHWLRLGYVCIAAVLLLHLAYIGSDAISLSKDEAYQWMWSKHLDWSYYSKPPGIALIQFAGTSLWGDNEFGVRFFSPVFAAILSWVMLRFMAAHVGARQGFILLLALGSTPLLGVGSVLMTIDPPLVLCWCLAMVAGWRALQPAGLTRDWLLTGLWIGLGFLCKYSALYLLVCLASFFLLYAPARVHLRRPGPWLALVVAGLCTLPVLVWNSRHDWITATHVASNASLASSWKPSLKFVGEFLAAEVALLNMVFFFGALGAAAAFWKHRARQPLWVYFFCMGLPVFLAHFLYSFRARILPNWIAPAVVPMFCLMVVYWDARWREGFRAAKVWFLIGAIPGLLLVGLMHESDGVGKLAGKPLPAELDWLRRVRAWKETTAVVEAARQRLLQDGKPAFIISEHYGMAGLFSFYLPQARAAVGSASPLVYSITPTRPNNQLYFWPHYRYRQHRAGQNAIYVHELDTNRLGLQSLRDWWQGRPITYARQSQPLAAPPARLTEEFASVRDLGVHEVKLGKRVFRRVQLFECRGLRPPAVPGS
jgi:4-amino-4-deoxy-L-arabinose transferase-like glycosyltransferase/membrane-associated phospholipid phosphatase